MKKPFNYLFISFTILVFIACNQSNTPSKNQNVNCLIIAEIGHDNDSSLFEYDEQNRIIESVISGISYKYTYDNKTYTIVGKKRNTDSVVYTSLVLLGDNGFPKVANGIDNSSLKGPFNGYPFLDSFFYDNDGHLIKEKHISSSSSWVISMNEYKYSGGNKIQAISYHDIDTLYNNLTYYTDKDNTINILERMPIYNLGIGSKNLMKSDSTLMLLFTPHTFKQTYKFDESGKVIARTVDSTYTFKYLYKCK